MTLLHGELRRREKLGPVQFPIRDGTAAPDVLTPNSCPLRPYLRNNNHRATGFGFLGQVNWSLFPQIWSY